VRVARGGPDPDADGPWTTTLLPVSVIAAREGFDIAINGDFFSAKSTKDIEGRNTGYVRGKAATPEGMAMTDGQLWHQSKTNRPYLVITTNHTALLFSGNSSDPTNAGAWEMIGGRQILVKKGKAIEYTSAFAIARHPRTAVGIDRTGKLLTLVVVDGRQPTLSIGMTLHELSAEMVARGCDSAINLDGGGSTTMVYRDPATHLIKVVNSPSDTKERSVADALGIIAHAPIPPAN
jgi:exopolysaccharide biosynthesis protein